MTHFIQARIDVALALCSVASEMLGQARCLDVSEKLKEIRKELESNDLQHAFYLYRLLPRHDIAGFWDDWDWMEEDATRTPIEQKSLLAAYYQRTLEALGDLRVTVLYGRNRPVVDASSDAISKLAKTMVEEKARRAKAC